MALASNETFRNFYKILHHHFNKRNQLNHTKTKPERPEQQIQGVPTSFLSGNLKTASEIFCQKDSSNSRQELFWDTREKTKVTKVNEFAVQQVKTNQTISQQLWLAVVIGIIASFLPHGHFECSNHPTRKTSPWEHQSVITEIL